MMKNILEYKGYHTKIEVDLEDGILYGKIEGIRDLVNFESETLDDLEKEFHLAVDDYLSFCEEVGKTPEKEYKGSFNVRVSPELHRQLALLAFKNSESLNQTVEKAIEAYISGRSQTEITLQETMSTLTNALENQKSYSKMGSSSTVPFLGIGKDLKMSYQS